MHFSRIKVGRMILRPWRSSRRRRRGASTLDYVLTMGVALPLVGILYVAGPKMMNLVNQMTTILVSWPFL